MVDNQIDTSSRENFQTSGIFLSFKEASTSRMTIESSRGDGGYHTALVCFIMGEK